MAYNTFFFMTPNQVVRNAYWEDTIDITMMSEDLYNEKIRIAEQQTMMELRMDEMPATYALCELLHPLAVSILEAILSPQAMHATFPASTKMFMRSHYSDETVALYR